MPQTHKILNAYSSCKKLLLLQIHGIENFILSLNGNITLLVIHLGFVLNVAKSCKTRVHQNWRKLLTPSVTKTHSLLQNQKRDAEPPYLQSVLVPVGTQDLHRQVLPY